MKVLVCGGRHFKNRALLDLTLDRVHARRPFDCVIHGGAEGADLMAGQWAELNLLDIEVFEAHWNTYHGNRAGNVRNARMLREGKPDLVIAFEGGSGTQDMICKSLTAGLPVLVVTPTGLIRRLGTDKSAAL